jgi:zinc transporter 7
MLFYNTPSARRIGLALIVGIAFFSALATAHETFAVGELSVSQIEERLQVRH